MLHQRFDRTLKMTTSSQKLKLIEIKKLFSNIARQRKREEYPLMKPAKPETYGKEVALVRYMLREFDNELAFIPPVYEHGALRVMVENEFSDLMIERSGSQIWKRISYIQSVVKCKTGIGESYVFTYYSHDANDSNAIFELQRAGKEDNEEYENSLSSNLQNYCNFICKRIAYNLAIHSQYELLRFCPEFIIDDNGKIWLTYATRISVREIEINDREQEVLFKRVELRNVESKERLNEELQSGLHDPKAPHQLRMLTEMSKHYGDLKSKMGIDNLFKDKPRDPLSNDAFAKLRPLNPYSLYDLIEPSNAKQLAEKKSYDNIKTKRIKLSARSASKSNLVQVQSGRKWNIKKITYDSSRIIPRTSSRFSEHLKSWIGPSKNFSIAMN